MREWVCPKIRGSECRGRFWKGLHYRFYVFWECYVVRLLSERLCRAAPVGLIAVEVVSWGGTEVLPVLVLGRVRSMG